MAAVALRRRRHRKGKPRSTGPAGDKLMSAPMPALKSSTSGSRQHYEVAVVGAGQAGLAVGYFLARQGRRFVIVERAAEIAKAWRVRWTPTTPFTPRPARALPGLRFPATPG